MKAIFKTGVMALTFAFLLSGSAMAAEKVAYVNLSRLFDEYHKTKDFDKVLEEKYSGLEDERNQKIEKIRELQGKLALLNDDKKAETETEIETLKQDLLEFDQQNRTSLTQERNEKIREILLEIEKIVSDYAEKNGHELILNDRVLIYGQQSDDLTEKILAILNEGK